MIAMAGAAGIFGEGSSSGSIANSPLGIYSLAMFFSKLLLILVPAICGMAIYRDHVSNFSGLLYTYPFTEWEYLSAKFMSSFIVVMIIAIFVIAGLVAGTYLPGVDTSLMTINEPVVYMHVFVVYLFPNLLFFSIIVFSAVALTRNIYAGFIVLVLSVIMTEIISRVSGAYGINMPGLLADPFGEKATGALTQVFTRSQRDSLPIPISEVIVLNRLLWLLLGAIVSIVTVRNFSFCGRELYLRRNRKSSAKNPVNYSVERKQARSYQSTKNRINDLRFGIRFNIQERSVHLCSDCRINSCRRTDAHAKSADRH
jgi:ABC-2 type transport system permease protein